jgi:cell wall-associated NlpC family hydrolase
MKKKRISRLAAFGFALCAFFAWPLSAQTASEQKAPSPAAVVEAALSFLGRREISVGGKNFTDDCSGTVRAILYAAGYRIEPDLAKYPSRSATQSLYALFRAQNFLRDRDGQSGIKPGDILFWDNTYDRNANGLSDDELSHVGVAVAVSPEGDVDFVHYYYGRGVVLARLNLIQPAAAYAERDGLQVLVNTTIRDPAWKPDGLKLASELFRAAASLP